MDGASGGIMSPTRQAEPYATQPQQCYEKKRLLESYKTAAARFSLAVEALAASRATVGKREYERLREYSEQARIQSEK
jgi:hypothetical protein